MIDLHMHTTNSDGSDTPKELIKKCEELKLKYISITDHDTCKSYEDIKEYNLEKIFSGKIIPGCEITTTYKGRTIEILGYDIDTNIVNEWLTNFYTIHNREERLEYCKRSAIDKLSNIGINLDIKSLDTDCSYDWAIYRKLILNKEENEKIIGKGKLDNIRFFFRGCLSNPKHELFINVEKYRPTPKEVTELIHRASGKAFLAHAYQYAFEDHLKMITELREECDLDGIEAFHSSFTLDQMIKLQEYAKKNKLYISGGSDYHGNIKPEISLKTGCNNLHISKNILDWLEKD